MSGCTRWRVISLGCAMSKISFNVINLKLPISFFVGTLSYNIYDFLPSTVAFPANAVIILTFKGRLRVVEGDGD